MGNHKCLLRAVGFVGMRRNANQISIHPIRVTTIREQSNFPFTLFIMIIVYVVHITFQLIHSRYAIRIQFVSTIWIHLIHTGTNRIQFTTFFALIHVSVHLVLAISHIFNSPRSCNQSDFQFTPFLQPIRFSVHPLLATNQIFNSPRSCNHSDFQFTSFYCKL